MKRNLFLILLIGIFMTFLSTVFALNPFINQLLNADPSAHEFEGRMYVYPSHDKDNATFFDMEDYHVYSSADMKNWIDHGVVLTYKDPDWVMKNEIDYPVVADDNCRHPRMWAPDCAFKNSTYYFYYPARDEENRFRIGVATSKSPSGPFIPVKYGGYENYIPKTFSMDPAVFVDDDGKAYMFFGGLSNGQLPRVDENLLGCSYWAELDTDHPDDPEKFMVSFKNDPQPVKGYDLSQNIGNVGKDAPFYWFEASWVHKRDNKYYLSYSTGNNIPGTTKSRIHYAMSDNIAGPWTYMGEVIGEVVGWTNHHSIAKFNGSWYAFYHNSEMSVDAEIGRRCICADALYYDQYGRILPVITTREGTGTSAYSRIKAMFYSYGSGVEKTELCEGGDIGFCVSSIDDNDYIYFKGIDFGGNGVDTFEVQVSSEGCPGGNIEIRKDSINGEILGFATIPQGLKKWTNISAITYVSINLNGIHDIYLRFVNPLTNKNLFKLNWFTFRNTNSSPSGHQVAFKSLNPNCIEYNISNQGQMYLCVDSNFNYDLCANRSAVAGAWEKFNLKSLKNLGTIEDNTVYIQSSNNNLNLVGGQSGAPIKARIKDNREPTYADCYYWITNSDGTISLKNKFTNKYICVDTWYHTNNPAKAYENRDEAQYAEKFYCETGDAPIGYVVAFKSQNPGCKDNEGGVGQKYLCADTNAGNSLCVNRAAVGGTWEKFLVVDANNGYVALKSLNTNQFIKFNNDIQPGTLYGGSTLDSQNNYTRFQWKNNGDGTVSLFNVGVGKYLCVDTDGSTGKSNNPARCYANRDKVDQDSNGISWEKFYCQIMQ